VKELRLDGLCDMGIGNAFLPEFLERFNEKFSVRAARAGQPASPADRES
jgi:hypothetical protein